MEARKCPRCGSENTSPCNAYDQDLTSIFTWHGDCGTSDYKERVSVEWSCMDCCENDEVEEYCWIINYEAIEIPIY